MQNSFVCRYNQNETMIVDTTTGMVTFSNSRACTNIIVPIEDIKAIDPYSDESFNEDTNIEYWADSTDGEHCVGAYTNGSHISVWMSPEEAERFVELIA